MTSQDVQEIEKQFAGNELDEPADEAGESIPEKRRPSGPEKRHQWPKKLYFLLATALCMGAAGIGYFSVQEGYYTAEREKLTAKKVAADTKNKLFTLKPFVVPFDKTEKSTYLLLTISFALEDRKLAEEVVKNKARVRGIIYDTLRKNISGTGPVPPLAELKKAVICQVNTALTAGQIKNLYVVEFLIV